MEYSKIVSVTGLPGLHELISSKADGAIVRSLEDKSTRFASGRIHNFSHLESIEVYTTGDNVNLAVVFHAMKEEGSLPDTKDNAVIKKYFEKVFPEIDFDRVYNSDLKKMIKWFEVLKKHNVEIKISEPADETDTQVEEITPPEKAAPTKKEPAKATKSEPAGKTAKDTDEKAGKKPAAKSDKPAKKAPSKKGK